jgi:two-component system nitrogen regulation response regulator NtrX
MLKQKKISDQPLALIVDDEPAICETLAGVLSDEGWNTVTAKSGNEALEHFQKQTFHVVFLDVWMKGIDGIETLQRMKAHRTDVPVVIMSGHGTIDTAVRATKLGAHDFLEKPLSLSKIIPILEFMTTRMKGLDESTKIIKIQDSLLIGESEAIKSTRKQIEMIAPRNSWVLITGENGVGKEIVARNIYSLSSRSNRAFIAVNCAAIPEELIESELFGHAKGAFTNAIAHKRGKFELAHHGTLFLDEIGDMSLRTQAKILRILQEQSFERLGSDETIAVDVRVIAATNKNLHEEIKKGNFREDLYYRLNVIPVEICPLRERCEDIPILTDYFLKQMALELNEVPKRVSSEAMAILVAYSWPGNVRELKNMLERLSILVPDSVIDVSHLPETLHAKSPDGCHQESADQAKTLKEARFEFEKTYILGRLALHDWNVSKTAEVIGLERSNLHRKLRLYGIDLKKLKG